MGDSRYTKYIQSEEWAQIKIDLIQIRGCKCQNCGGMRKPSNLHVHHLTYERLFNELPEDLILLCPVCHMQQHPDKIPENVLKKMERTAIYKEKQLERGKKYIGLTVFTNKPNGLTRKDFPTLVNTLKAKIAAAGHKGVKERRLGTGYQFKFECGTNLNIYHTCSMVIQGKNAHLLRDFIM